MGRISIEEQFKNIFNEDYTEVLYKLLEKDFSPEEISQYIKSQYNIEVKKATIKIHLAKIEGGISTKKSAKNSLSEKGINYKELLESLSHLTKEEISNKIEEDHGIKIQASTIYQYALKYGVKIATKRVRKKKKPTDLEYISKELKSTHNNSLLINKLPLPPKRFHPTKQSGFVIFKDIDAIIELCARLIIKNINDAHIELWIKIFKDDLVEETFPIYDDEIPKEMLLFIDEFNYVKVCKSLCEKNIEKLQNLNIPQLRSMLIVHCKDQKSMEKLLSKCHASPKKD